jgi:hypothetical protein
MKCLSEFHVFGAWSPTGAVVLGGFRNFRRWDLAGENRSLGADPWGCLVPNLFLPVSASCSPGGEEALLPHTPTAIMFYPNPWDQARME